MRHHPPDPLNDDQFDNALDAMLRGDRDSDHLRELDPAMASTLDQLIGWSELSGFASEPPSQPLTADVPRGTDDAIAHRTGTQPDVPVPIQASPMPRPLRYPRASRRTIIVSTFSSLAAMLLLGLTLYGAAPFLSDRTDHTETPTTIMLAGADGTQLASGGDIPTPITSDTPIGVPGVNADGVDPLTSDECTVTPLTREDVIAILRTPPGEYADVANARELRSFPDDGSQPGIPLPELNAVFREWQACVKFGETWRYMALQTDYMTRADIYGPQLLSRPALIEGYSDSTLNEILDGRLQVDEQRRKGWEDHLSGDRQLPASVLVIDQTADLTTVSFSADGTYIAHVPVAKLNQATGETIAPHGTVDFELVDGQWRIANIHNLDF